MHLLSAARGATVAVAVLALALVPGATTSGDGDAVAQERSTERCPAPPPAADFDDRDEVSPVHRAAVDCLAYLDVARGLGYEEGVRYLPQAEVRRGQMASFIGRALEAAGADLPAPRSAGFEDIAGSPHEERIQQLAAIGVTEGRTATSYAPLASVDRDQMASFLLRATAWYQGVEVGSLAGGPTRFGDVPSGNVHAATIAGVYHLGIAQGVAADRYAPERPVSRQQMASFVVGTLDVAERDPAVCTNDRDRYSLTMPAGWVTNPGDVEPRCTVFATERFVLQPATEYPADTSARVYAEALDHEEAADRSDFREEISRRSDQAGERDAIVVESRATGGGLLPEGTRVHTWYVDAVVDGQDRTLIATTDDRAADYEANVEGLDQMMATLVLGG
jgi:hypothetical protein